MQVYRFLALLGFALPLAAQTPCAPTPMYSPCDIVFELNAQEARQHLNPYLTVQLQAEFRSPRKRTFLMPAFWDGGTRMVIRFSPTEAGDWDFRVTSNLTRFDGMLGKFTATESPSPGFVKAANVHHWAYSESNKAHLWMGDTNYRFAEMDRALFEQFVRKRAGQKFNHVRGVVVGMSGDGAFPTPDQPDTAWFREVDSRVRFINQNGLMLDLVIAQHENHLTKLFPTWQQRERYVRYLVARYAAMDITWQGVQEFDDYSGGRPLMKEVGLLLKKLDPYQHPRSTHTRATSAPLAADGWMDYLTYQSSADDLGAIEHQLYQLPQVNAEFAYEDSGAGRVYPHHVDSDTFRKRLWNATMNGQYPTFGNTGTYGGQAKLPQDAKYLDSPGAKAMTAWFDFFMRTRHWELEPFFDVDGGRALALDEIEYIVYVEKPSAPIEVLVAKHNYDVYWLDPATGELAKQKNFNGDKYVGEPPDKKHDWVLHLSRDGRKEGMLRSYKFESRPVPIQEVETNLQKVPYEIAQPAGDEISLSRPFQYAVKLKRETRATRSMMYLWTGEVPTEGQGFRVMATGASGSLRIPGYLANNIAKDFPAVFTLHVAGMNANGKVYFTSKVYRLVK
jgi:hypothetical protein